MKQGLLQFMRATMGVTRAAVGLRTQGFARCCAGLLVSPAEQAPVVVDVDALLLAHRRTHGRLPWSTCLTRSVALCRALRRRHLPAVLRLGVAKQALGLHAHAWVELQGRALEAVDHLTALPRARSEG